MAVAYFSSDTLTGIPYTTLPDVTRRPQALLGWPGAR